ncbi:MAG: hypothetical protein ACP5O2_12530 [Bacteroidales bacterium]
MLKKFVVISALATFPIFSFAQPQPPNNGGNNPGGGNTPVGGSAPIGGGIALLLSMAAAYGAKKVYDARQKLTE